jgi:Spy/CpxP family protein refolding chaperone
MKKKWIFLGTMLLVVINISALATIGYIRFYNPRILCPAKDNRLENELFYRQLSLSKRQIEKIRHIREPFAAETGRMCAMLTQKREELVGLMANSRPDSEKIHRTLASIDSAQAELQEKAIHYLLREKEILTPDQQEIFFSVIRERLHCAYNNSQKNGLDPFTTDSCTIECQKENGLIKTNEGR